MPMPHLHPTPSLELHIMHRLICQAQPCFMHALQEMPKEATLLGRNLDTLLVQLECILR